MVSRSQALFAGLLLYALVLCAGPSAAHGNAAEATAFLPRWTWDLWILIPLALLACLYLRGLARSSIKATADRAINWWRVAAFASGWLCLAFALVSPIHWLGERLVSAHMIEHELVMVVAAPLLALARPISTSLWALPASWRRDIEAISLMNIVVTAWRRASDPLTATLVHGIAIWIWHAPALFDDAVSDAAVHRLQHLTFFGTALLFWWALFRRSTRDYGMAALHLFITMIHTSLLGVLLVLSPRLLYGADAAFAEICGLSPIEDQQLAGLLMWIPAGLIYAAAALTMAGLWIANASTDASKTDHHVVHAR
jgi:cytochrome c oxidase assembly factor CtaG